ncbi:DUF7563 family protein [Natrarchaeobius chitinivorans]
MGTCRSCGSHVSRQYVRVFGDQGNVYECPSCSSRSPDSHIDHTAPPQL